jgi:cytochrome c oxidase accessory protein FixG
MLFLLIVFIGVVLMTAIVGRAWCGWACPQTVYMEFLFRPIERLFEGNSRPRKSGVEKFGIRTFAKHVVFLGLSVIVGNLFLSYFVGTDALSHWLRSSPAAHPTAFLVMGVTAALVFLDFAYFREQMCTVVCPYARLQSALLDQKSLIVAYDVGRGEPRGKKGRAAGDCVDCKVCVAACPTGIDIRNGLQLECIGCTQCIDACDGVMDKIGRSRGLIRYTSQEGLAGKRFDVRSFLRARVLVYVAALLGVSGALAFTVGKESVADVSVLRGLGEPFVLQGELVRNHVRIKIENRSDREAAFPISLVGASDVALISPENPMHVAARSHATSGFFVLAPRESFHAGRRDVRIKISGPSSFEQMASYRLLGPEEGTK